mgnify:CR=1 FL=1
MKISEIYNLNKNQFQLDFVDIDVDSDTPLFLDSNLIRNAEGEFYQQMKNTMDCFFTDLINLLSNSMIEKARNICRHLGEINETHLGLSKNESRGRGVGEVNSDKIINALKSNEAIMGGYLENIEDLRVLVEGFNKDMLSDMLTNILKKHLIDYTKAQCNLNNIQMTESVVTGSYWNAEKHKWENGYDSRLVINSKPVLLVPKNIVSFCLDGSCTKYRQHFVLNFLQDLNIKNRTLLVRERKKTKQLYVTKKSILENEPPMNKEYLTSFTIKYPEVLKRFKENNKNKIKPLNGDLFNDINVSEICQILRQSLVEIEVGTEQAAKFHDLMIGIFEFLLYPNLTNPVKEKPINNGRKRIDICFTNSSKNGIFSWIPEKAYIPCPYVFVECKNYSNDVKNPELDQMIGRFSTRRGKLGIISCRRIDDEDLFISRCIDSYKENGCLIIPIVDADIYRCLEKNEKCCEEFEKIITEKTDKIILS